MTLLSLENICIKLYKREVSKFVEDITMQGIKAILDTEVERRHEKPHKHSNKHDCY